MGSGNKNFKVGDWVIELCPDVDDYCKPKPSGKPKQIKKIKQGNTGLLYRLASDNYKRWLRQQDIIHWQPKVGDWCWFFNKDRIPVISKLQEICTDGNRKYFAVYFNGETKFGAYYESCKPFIGVPPNA